MIGPAIYALLNNDSTIQGLTNGRITPGIIPQAQAVPCIYYGTDRIKLLAVRNPMGCFSGTLEVGFQVDEDAYDTLEALTTAIRKVLDKYSGTIAGISLAINNGQSTPDDFDDKLRFHTRALEFDISGQFITP